MEKLQQSDLRLPELIRERREAPKPSKALLDYEYPS